MTANFTDRYPDEELGDWQDDGTMPENLAELRGAVVGHRIVSVERKETPLYDWSDLFSGDTLVITLDNGKRVRMVVNEGDCCAYTELQKFLLHPDRVNHVITGVGTEDGYQRWHIYADMGDVLELTVGWSAGNAGYYGYGFNIYIEDIEED